MSRLKDQVIWITGASSGIGEALTYKLAKEGAKLVLSARRENELLRVKQNCNLKEDSILILPFDLTDTSNVDGHTQKVIRQFGKVDILINNGGVSQRSLAVDTSLELDRQILEINFFSSVALTKSVLPYMLKQKSGHIVVMSSIAGKFGFFLRSAYSAAKHALQGFFESLRLEVEKEGIKVTIVCPGKIKTNVSLNAITSKGSSHGLMDPSHETGMSADACAEKIIQAIINNKEEVLIGGKEILAVRLKQYCPYLFSKLIRKQKPL